jgi:hypothetical protein
MRIYQQRLISLGKRQYAINRSRGNTKPLAGDVLHARCGTASSPLPRN